MYILSVNPKKSKIFEKYYQFEKIFWKSNILAEKGEEVYLYCSGDCHKIMFKCKVEKTNISYEEVKMNIKDESYNIIPEKKYILLKFLKFINSEKLSSINLKEYGFNPPQHACKLKNDKLNLINLIEQGFLNCKNIDDDELIPYIAIEGENKYYLSAHRRGQEKLRKNLISLGEKCPLCNLEKPEFLKVSHIKPWRNSDRKEKVEVNNAFLMCPNHDILFDKGYISFSSSGELLISDELSDEIIKEFKLNKNCKIKISAAKEKFLKYHRNNIFKK